MQAIIRNAELADAAALSALARATFIDTYGAFNSAQDMKLHVEASYTPALQAAEIGNVDMLTILADDAGQLTAFTQLRRSETPQCVLADASAPQAAWELLRFYVQREWHGQGLASPLMNAAWRSATRAGADALWLSVWSRNERAQAFYRKCGFRCVGDTTFTVGRDVQHDLVMLRSA